MSPMLAASPASRVSRELTPAKVQPGARASINLAHFERFCATFLRLDNGQPLRLEPFQKRILADYFDGVRETLILLPSGNAKTTLLAAVALHHLLYTESPEVFIMAASRDQAGRMHEHIRGFVERSRHGRRAGLETVVAVQRRGITLLRRKGFLEVMAADANTADGIGPTLAIIDELHRHKDTSLYEVALKGLKKRQGRMVHCSTAGDTVHSPLGELRARCLALPSLRRDGMHTYARAADDTIAFHEYALDELDDPDDIETVKLANPLASITVEDLAAEHAAMKPWAWARFACGLWVAGEHSAISPIDLAAVTVDKVDMDPARGQLLSVDLAWVGDCTAITAVQAVDRDHVRARKVAIVRPRGDGTVLREEEILAPIREYARENRIAGVVLDPEAGGRALIERLEDLGLEVIEHSQKNDPMCDAYAQLHGAIRRRRDPGDPDGPRALELEADQELAAQILAAQVKVMPDGRAKLVKRRKNPEPIDGGVSLAMGVRVALAELDSVIDTSDWSIEQ